MMNEEELDKALTQIMYTCLNNMALGKYESPMAERCVDDMTSRMMKAIGEELK